MIKDHLCEGSGKRLKTRIKADAEAQMKTSEANQGGSEEVLLKQGRRLSAAGTEARQEAATEQRDAGLCGKRRKSVTP